MGPIKKKDKLISRIETFLLKTIRQILCYFSDLTEITPFFQQSEDNFYYKSESDYPIIRASIVYGRQLKIVL